MPARRNSGAEALPKLAATRRQLSMYVPAKVGHDIEALRRILDPVQHRLIPARVTLAREADLDGLPEAELRSGLSDPALSAVTLAFGQAERFSSHGLLLPCQGGEEGFQAMRQRLLGSGATRVERSHLTLAHPRNPKAPGNSLAAARSLPDAFTITFPTIVLIEQRAGGPWVVLPEINLLA